MPSRKGKILSWWADLVFTRTKDIWAKDNIPVVLICNVKYEGPDNICHNYLDWEVKSDPIPQIVKDTIEQGKGLSGVHLSGTIWCQLEDMFQLVGTPQGIECVLFQIIVTPECFEKYRVKCKA